jgi:hypothetical protein
MSDYMCAGVLVPTSSEWIVTVTVRFESEVEAAYAEGAVRTMLDGRGVTATVKSLESVDEGKIEILTQGRE